MLTALARNATHERDVNSCIFAFQRARKVDVIREVTSVEQKQKSYCMNRVIICGERHSVYARHRL